MAMAERTTNICQMTKLLLVNLISASPNDSAKTVKIITLTASGILSVRVLVAILRITHFFAW